MVATGRTPIFAPAAAILDEVSRFEKRSGEENNPNLGVDVLHGGWSG